MKNEKNNKKNGWNPNDILNFEEYFKKIFENFFNSNFNEKMIGQNLKKSSFTYKFDTGMEKPEISLNGKQIDEEILKKMINNSSPFNLGQKDVTNQINAKDISLPVIFPEVTTRHEVPFYEIYDDIENEIEVTIELPGSAIEDISIKYLENGVIISGVNEGDNMYQKTIEIKFKPKSEKTKIYGNNSIFQITFKK